MAIRVRVAVIVVVALLFAFSGQLAADTVVLRNGERHTGVRAIAQDDYVNIVNKQGQIRVVPKRDVSTIIPEPVDWEQDEAKLRERIRVLSQERERLARAREVEPLSALWRSALLPGWGQLRKDSEIKGFSIIGASALCTLLLYASARDHEAPLPKGTWRGTGLWLRGF